MFDETEMRAARSPTVHGDAQVRERLRAAMLWYVLAFNVTRLPDLGCLSRA